MPETTEPTLDLSVIEQKRKTWGDFGVVIYKNETTLQLAAQTSAAKLSSLPVKVEDIPEAEVTLKEVKADRLKIEEARKQLTAKLDQLKERLMRPEKSLEEPIATFEATIIQLKQVDREEKVRLQIRHDEGKRIVEQVMLYVADLHASFLTKQADLLANSYKYALESVAPKDLEEYKKKVMSRITEAAFTMPMPVVKSSILSDEEVAEIVKEHFIPLTPVAYIDSFRKDLDARFSDYNIAWNDKEAARLQAAKEDEANKSVIESTKTAQTIAAKFQSGAEALTPTSGTKDLKEQWEIDMPETLDSAIAILAAFVANKDKCVTKLKIDKWFNFNANSAGKALSKVKQDDPKFAPSGVKFKKVDKL